MNCYQISIDFFLAHSYVFIYSYLNLLPLTEKVLRTVAVLLWQYCAIPVPWLNTMLLMIIVVSESVPVWIIWNVYVNAVRSRTTCCMYPEAWRWCCEDLEHDVWWVHQTVLISYIFIDILTWGAFPKIIIIK